MVNVSKKYKERKTEEGYRQTIIMLRDDNKKALKTLAAINGIPMYEMLDRILNDARQELDEKLR